MYAGGEVYRERRIKEYRSEDITECVYIFDVNLDKSDSSVVDEKKADPERERRGKPAVKTTLLMVHGASVQVAEVSVG